MEKIKIFDTTLRDGEQSAGSSMSVEDKLLIADKLDEMNVDIIEAGFPYASKGDYDAVSKIAENTKNSIICGLARANFNDIDCAGKSLKKAKRPRIHTFISTSDLHMKYKLKMQKEEVIQAIKDSIKRAKKFTNDIEWSPEDASRTELDFLYRTIDTAINSGATTINIPDTVGYAIPIEFGKLIENIKKNVSNIDKATISVHCHNDLGLAVSNSLSAIIAGARQVECTINGIGERAGNAALEEIVMCLKTRKDLLPYFSDVDNKKISSISHLVSTITGFSVQPNKAIVGKNAFAHESGIHQDGMLKHSNTYEIITPESVGLSSSELVLGKHSGRHAFKVKLQNLGYKFKENKINELFSKFKNLADKKKQVFDEDLLALADEEYSFGKGNLIELIDISISSGLNKKAIAKVKLKFEKKMMSGMSDGSGPIDAVFKAIKKILSVKANLVVYQVNALTKGTDAQAEVSVRLEDEGLSVLGIGNDIDTMVASGKAYINGLNKLIQKKDKAADTKKALSSQVEKIDKHVI